MTGVRRVAGRDAALARGLCELLRDCVDHGASVGFLSPLDAAAAARYWERVLAAVEQGSLLLWVAEDGDRVVGSVQLEPCPKDNGRHRAELQKLLVLTAHRGRGLARALMAEAERFAREARRTLLVLDTEVGSVAESVYRTLGWTRAGEIPDYATTPAGKLHPTVYYYKRL
ncbi:MAG TPA: GNAT family N-acetyltransferase [Usitatibacter sp.]|nr:GNAT family N-acetyltransferase [Usitatibacter sp.]